MKLISTLFCLMLTMTSGVMAQVEITPLNFSAQTTQIGTSSLSALLSGKARTSTHAPVGVYIPLFQSANGLSNIAGTFGVAHDGGLVSSSAGYTASGVIPLPMPLDTTKPFRVGFLVQYNGDTTNNLIVNLQDSRETSYHEQGLSLNKGSLYLYSGGSGIQLTGAVSGQMFWYWMASDGGGTISYGIVPTTGGGQQNFSYYASAQASNWGSLPSNYTIAGQSVFHSLNQISISTSSAFNIIKGVFVNQGSLTGGTDTRCQPPAILIPSGIIGDTSAMVCLPPSYTGIKPSPVVLLMHPNWSDQRFGQQTFDPDGGAAFNLLLQHGYIVASIGGSDGRSGKTIYQDALWSNWGSEAGLAFREAELNWLRAVLPGTGSVYAVGESMGLDNALLFASTYPRTLKAIAGISGATNISDCYKNFGLADIINRAYESYYMCIKAGRGNVPGNGTYWMRLTSPGGLLHSTYLASPYALRGDYSSVATYQVKDVVTSVNSSLANVTQYDPQLKPKAFVGLPIKLWQGTDDTTISPTLNAPLFASTVNALGGNVCVVNISGAGHLDTASLWDGAALLAFFNAHP